MLISHKYIFIWVYKQVNWSKKVVKTSGEVILVVNLVLLGVFWGYWGYWGYWGGWGYWGYWGGCGYWGN